MPPTVNYSSTNTLTIGQSIVHRPSISGTYDAGTLAFNVNNIYLSNSSTSTGLTISSDGTISGTPVVLTDGTETIQVHYSYSEGGVQFSTTAFFNYLIIDIPPSSLSYPSSSLLLTVGSPMPTTSPTVGGGDILLWEISPPLPTGMLFDMTIGEISGTPNAVDPETLYTITATNSGGTTTTTISIRVTQPPSTGGDPYVTTLKGITYKLDNISGVCRMLQGSIDGTPLIINAEMKKDSYQTEEEMNKWALAHDADRQKIYNQSFYTRILAKFGTDSVAIIDLEKGEISNSQGSKIQITRCNSEEVGSSLDMYSYETKCRAACDLHFGKATLRVKWFENRQLRNEFSISGAEFVKNADGFIIRPMSTKQCRVKKIGTDKMIKMGDSIMRKSVLETFYTIQEDGVRRSKSLNIQCV